MVEMAIVLLLFLVIVFAVIEFSVVILRSAQLAEATRNGVRYAIVNDPVKEGVTLPACIDGGESTGPLECDAGSCPGMIEGMANIAPFINAQDQIVVTVTYTCPQGDYVEHNGLYLVTVKVDKAQHKLWVPALFNLGTAIQLSTFKATRLSEDLHTAGAGG
jgi:hypothetical protein